MRRVLLILAGISIAVTFGLWVNAQQTPLSDEPRYTAKNEMLRPSKYREWVWLSSGLGMSYRPGSSGAERANPPFDNVFAAPAAYRSFMQTGKWPDKTVLVLEARGSVSKESINQSGHFQGAFMDLEAHVKDESRFPGKWAFFAFGDSSEAATAIPTTAACYSCHAQSAAVDTTFVQFYPTLFEVAKQKGTLRTGYEEPR